jgi:hypothetical protein
MFQVNAQPPAQRRQAHCTEPVSPRANAEQTEEEYQGIVRQVRYFKV